MVDVADYSSLNSNDDGVLGFVIRFDLNQGFASFFGVFNEIPVVVFIAVEGYEFKQLKVPDLLDDTLQAALAGVYLDAEREMAFWTRLELKHIPSVLGVFIFAICQAHSESC